MNKILFLIFFVVQAVVAQKLSNDDFLKYQDKVSFHINGNLDSAFYYAKKSKVAEDYVNALENYALYYEAISDYKTANGYNKKFFTAKDSVFKNSNLENLHELEVKYKSAQKDAEISKNKAEIAELKQEKQMEKVLESIFGELSQSNAGTVLVNLEDAWFCREPQNVPGTWKEKPNWRHKSRYSNKELDGVAYLKWIVEKINRARNS